MVAVRPELSGDGTEQWNSEQEGDAGHDGTKGAPVGP
jgi:hypothetical protein